MIIDVIENANLYIQINDRFKKAFDFLRNTDFLEISTGKHELEGNEIYAIVDSYYTCLEKKFWEAHRRYIDIQFVVNNCEQMGYAYLKQMKQITEYDQDKDLIFYEGSGSFFTVTPDTFVIFFPHDVHMPGIAVEKPEIIKKIVIKILVD